PVRVLVALLGFLDGTENEVGQVVDRFADFGGGNAFFARIGETLTGKRLGARFHVAAGVLRIDVVGSPRSLIPGSPLLQQLVALLAEPVELFLLRGDAVGVAALVAGAGIGRGLLDELTDIVAHNGHAALDLRKRKRIAVAHVSSPRLPGSATILRGPAIV